MKNKKLKFIDLFAGLGGFHQATKGLDMRCVFASEIDDDLRALYEANYKMYCHGDITKIKTTDIPKHDLLLAGFLCQSFSKAGKQGGMKDRGRGDLIYEVIRILKYHKPRYFVLENVPQLVTHNKGETWLTIYRLLTELGYAIQRHILSPHDYGIPQRRERLFIIGTRDGKELEFAPTLPRISYPEWNDSTLGGAYDRELIATSLRVCESEWFYEWRKLIKGLPTNKPMPKFCIDIDQFGKDDDVTKYPKWRQSHIRKCRKLYEECKDDFSCEVRNSIHQIKYWARRTWKQLTWQAGDEDRDLYNKIVLVRGSGLVVRRNDIVPTLTTSTEIIYKGQYMSFYELRLLQGFSEIELPKSWTGKLRALGNAVNVKIANIVLKKLLSE